MKIEEIILHPEAYDSKGNIKFREAQVDIFPYLIVYKVNRRKRKIYISSNPSLKKTPS
jgi:hypothetical protein